MDRCHSSRVKGAAARIAPTGPVPSGAISRIAASGDASTGDAWPKGRCGTRRSRWLAGRGVDEDRSERTSVRERGTGVDNDGMTARCEAKGV